MALYAFDGTWNSDEENPVQDTNVVRFKELYTGVDVEYLEGVGTRWGSVGRVLGGLLGTGGRTRIDEMYEDLCENWREGDRDIDIIGFSRGAALALHFANKIADDGVKLTAGGTERPIGLRSSPHWGMRTMHCSEFYRKIKHTPLRVTPNCITLPMILIPNTAITAGQSM